jgi:hypothetical protein
LPEFIPKPELKQINDPDSYQDTGKDIPDNHGDVSQPCGKLPGYRLAF